MWEVSEKKQKQNKKHASRGRSLKNECIVLYYVCVCITECALHTASLIQKVFPYKTHFIRYILKYYKKHLRFFFLSFFFFLNMVTSAAVRASITTNMSNE